MAKYSYSSYMESTRSASPSHGADRKVGYFKLADDGDKALVRFDYSNPEEFEVYDVHRFKNREGYYRNVLCLKESVRDPDSKCPFCAAGFDKYPLRTKFYVKLIQYVRAEDGSIKVEPKVWERPAGFVKEMKSLIDDYGDLRDVVFTISRNGERGSRDTTYSVNMALPAKYNEQNGYVKDFSGFDGFNLVGHSFMSRDYDEMQEFIETGDFPMRKRDSRPAAQPAQPTAYPSQPAYPTADPTAFDDMDYDPLAPVDDKPSPRPTAPQPQKAADPTVARPRRVYTY